MFSFPGALWPHPPQEQVMRHSVPDWFRFQFIRGTVRAVPIFGSGCERLFLNTCTVLTGKARFRFRFLGIRLRQFWFCFQNLSVNSPALVCQNFLAIGKNRQNRLRLAQKLAKNQPKLGQILLKSAKHRLQWEVFVSLLKYWECIHCQKKQFRQFQFCSGLSILMLLAPIAGNFRQMSGLTMHSLRRTFECTPGLCLAKHCQKSFRNPCLYSRKSPSARLAVFLKPFAGQKNLEKQWWHTEQAKAKFDPRVGPPVAHEWVHESPHESPHESTHEDWFPCFQPFKDSPRNIPRRCPWKGPRVDGRGSPVLFSPVLFFDRTRRRAFE